MHPWAWGSILFIVRKKFSFCCGVAALKTSAFAEICDPVLHECGRGHIGFGLKDRKRSLY